MLLLLMMVLNVVFLGSVVVVVSLSFGSISALGLVTSVVFRLNPVASVVFASITTKYLPAGKEVAIDSVLLLVV